MVALGELRAFLACAARGGAPKPVEEEKPEPPKVNVLEPEPAPDVVQADGDRAHETASARFGGTLTTSSAFGYGGQGMYSTGCVSEEGVFIRRGRNVYKLVGRMT